jgi:hypothetical protein
MAYELNPGSGNIFKNQYKKEDRHPDYKGQVRTPDGQVLDVALWIKDGKKGKFFSVSLQEPRQQEGRAPRAVDNRADDFDDDVPF